MGTIRSVLGQIRRRVRPTKDEKWLSLLEQSTRTRVTLKGIELPSFPPDELQISTIGSAGVPAIREAFRFYVFVRDACARQGRRLGSESKVLDFGVAWGRTLRCFLNDVSPQSLYGVDVSQEYMDAAKASGVPGSFALIDPRGALPHSRGFFDVVYAYSVFTHLPEDVQTHWLAEISRVLKPGGVLVATVEPRRFLQHCLSVDPVSDRSPRNRMVGAALRQRPTALEEFDRKGFLYLATSGESIPFGNAAMSPEYVRRHWGQWFTMADYLDDIKRFPQALVTALNR